MGASFLPSLLVFPLKFSLGVRHAICLFVVVRLLFAQLRSASHYLGP